MRKILKKSIECKKEQSKAMRSNISIQDNKQLLLFNFLKILLKEKIIGFHDVDIFQDMMRFTLDSMMQLQNNFKQERSMIANNQSSYIETTHTIKNSSTSNENNYDLSLEELEMSSGKSVAYGKQKNNNNDQ